MKQIHVKSNQREEMIDITAEVEAVLPNGDGICVLFTQHTTCGLTVNENADPDVQTDMLGWLRHVVPQFPTSPTFKHFEHNSDAHIKSSLMGSNVTIPFEKGGLCLGRWQGIYLCEFDGPRERTVLVKIVSTKQ
ncbi:MAG: secondary thiamine-phosphate synthase enzyme YjbQ [Pyrinomonadaceae bacterium]